ncbi:hypothetical protein [Desulfonema magnum]|uniref:Uncharacterized protein n=1 Tax=Desulfonema magnum TaxID=45655 RepID=A0A975BW38_9BACT|nr:hypothetical protein [Desulfonema magnum]QTA92870.1 Uncharacterized protein dnm_089630 [Desulfonema magnum]
MNSSRKAEPWDMRSQAEPGNEGADYKYSVRIHGQERTGADQMSHEIDTQTKVIYQTGYAE